MQEWKYEKWVSVQTQTQVTERTFLVTGILQYVF